LGVKKKRGPWGKLPPLLQFKLGISVRNIVSKRKNLKTRFQEVILGFPKISPVTGPV
jgi:hypothetical protein